MGSLVMSTVCAVAAVSWRIGNDGSQAETELAAASPLTASGNVAADTRVFTTEELAAHNGKTLPTIYISILGHVFDVSAGKKHYGPKASYAYFAGRDASRSFVTGDSAAEKLTDDVSGMSDEDLEGILGWYKFYEEHEEYKWVGRLAGRYFDPATGKAVEPVRCVT